MSVQKLSLRISGFPTKENDRFYPELGVIQTHQQWILTRGLTSDWVTQWGYMAFELRFITVGISFLK